jgi:hypothetical protein
LQAVDLPYLGDNSSGAIVFMGRSMNPQTGA